jgi:hypothetical protein
MDLTQTFNANKMKFLGIINNIYQGSKISYYNKILSNLNLSFYTIDTIDTTELPNELNVFKLFGDELPIEIKMNIFNYLCNECEIIAVAYSDHVDILDMQTMNLISRITTYIINIYSMLFTNDGTKLIITRDYKIYIFDIITETLIRMYDLTVECSNEQYSIQIKCSADNKKLYITTTENMIYRLWCININTGERMFNYLVEEQINYMHISPNNKYICKYIYYNDSAIIINENTGEILHEINNIGRTIVEFSDDNHLIILSYEGYDQYEFSKINFDGQIIENILPETIQNIRFYKSHKINRWSDDLDIYSYSVTCDSQIKYNINYCSIIKDKMPSKNKYSFTCDIKYSHSKKYVIGIDYYNNIIVFKIN